MRRRGFLTGVIAAAAAPAFVKSESLMGLWVPKSTYGFEAVVRYDAEVSYDAFVRHQMKLIARSLGTSYESLLNGTLFTPKYSAAKLFYGSCTPGKTISVGNEDEIIAEFPRQPIRV